MKTPPLFFLTLSFSNSLSCHGFYNVLLQIGAAGSRLSLPFESCDIANDLEFVPWWWC